MTSRGSPEIGPPAPVPAECRPIQLRLLDSLDSICARHGIAYWIDFGTLLGAVRHGGFIPWDDDIDVSMPAADYARFLQVAQAELPDGIFLQTPNSDPGYRQAFSKLRDCRSTLIERHERFGESYHQGIYLDIFPVVGYPGWWPRWMRRVVCSGICSARYTLVVARRRSVKAMLTLAAARLAWWTLAWPRGACLAQAPVDNGYGYAVPREAILPLGRISFEGREYSAPRDPHRHLQHMYGDGFLTPPPPSARTAHAAAILPRTPCFHPRSAPRETGAEQIPPSTPIAVFAYSSVDRLRSCLGALMSCPLAEASDVVVFSDAPSDANAAPGVAAVRSFLDLVKGFRSLTVIRRDENHGVERNIIDGVTWMLGRWDSVIVIEDDVVVTPSTLLYFSRALSRYRDDRRVRHISASTFIDLPDNTCSFVDYCEVGWGWATWGDRWRDLVWYRSREEALAGLDPGRLDRLTLHGTFPCLDTLDLRQIPWDICWYISIIRHDGLCLIPPRPMTTNTGLASGTHFSGWDASHPHPYTVTAHDQPDVVLPGTVERRPDGIERLASFFEQAHRTMAAHRPPLRQRILGRLSRAIRRLARPSRRPRSGGSNGSGHGHA